MPVGRLSRSVGAYGLEEALTGEALDEFGQRADRRSVELLTATEDGPADDLRVYRSGELRRETENRGRDRVLVTFGVACGRWARGQRHAGLRGSDGRIAVPM